MLPAARGKCIVYWSLKSKGTRCSRYGNGLRMHVILKGEPLEEVDCFKYLGSQVAAMEDVKGMV